MPAPADPMDLRMGDVLRLRKSHPCGSSDWQVVRLGADIGLQCLGCQRRVMLERPVLRRRIKSIVRRGEPITEEVARALFGEIVETDQVTEDGVVERDRGTDAAARSSASDGEVLR